MTPETEAKLNELVRRAHRSKDELLEDAVNCLLAYSEWFERKVKNRLETAQRGERVPGEDVRAWIEERERSDQKSSADPDFRPIEISGEPLSATIHRERR